METLVRSMSEDELVETLTGDDVERTLEAIRYLGNVGEPTAEELATSSPQLRGCASGTYSSPTAGSELNV